MDDFLGNAIPLAIADGRRLSRKHGQPQPSPCASSIASRQLRRVAGELWSNAMALPRPSRLACLASPGWGGPTFKVPRRSCRAPRSTFWARKEARNPTRAGQTRGEACQKRRRGRSHRIEDRGIARRQSSGQSLSIRNAAAKTGTKRSQ